MSSSNDGDHYADNLTVQINRSPLMSSATETDGGDTENELAAMRDKLNNLVSDHHHHTKSSVLNISLANLSPKNRNRSQTNLNHSSFPNTPNNIHT